MRSFTTTAFDVQCSETTLVCLCFYSGAPAARRTAKRSLILIWERKGNPSMDFLMVIIASGIVRGRVRTTTTTATTESHKTAAILQVIVYNEYMVIIKLKTESQTVNRKPHPKVTKLKSTFYLFLG